MTLSPENPRACFCQPRFLISEASAKRHGQADLQCTTPAELVGEYTCHILHHLAVDKQLGFLRQAYTSLALELGGERVRAIDTFHLYGYHKSV
jgi:hypothetical protein